MTLMMRIRVKVIPNASKFEIMGDHEMGWKIKVPAPPADGKANKAVIQLLARHFQVPKTHIRIITGEKSHQKVIEILDLPPIESQ